MSPVLRGLWNYSFVRGELQTARVLGEHLLVLAQPSQDAAMRTAAHHALGVTLFFLGAVASAHTHVAQGVALYDPKQHRASAVLYGDGVGVICHLFAARALWFLGSPDQGLAQSQQAVTLAQQFAHPFSVSYALSCAAMLHQLCRQACATQERAEAANRLATDQGFPLWVAYSAILCGWALAQQGQAQSGIEQMTQGLRAYRATGAGLLQPYFLALLAEAHGAMGQPEAGLTVLTEALTLTDTTGERWYEAESHRLKGELLLQQSSSNQTEAESCFYQAISIARSQQAKRLSGKYCLPQHLVY